MTVSSKFFYRYITFQNIVVVSTLKYENLFLLPLLIFFEKDIKTSKLVSPITQSHSSFYGVLKTEKNDSFCIFSSYVF